MPPNPGVRGSGLFGASIIGLCSGIPEPLVFEECETTRPLTLPADDGVYPGPFGRLLTLPLKERKDSACHSYHTFFDLGSVNRQM